MHFLVTAGPTREALDPVRFISNRSSGKMGYAVAAAAREAGHTVTLISGPVALEPPEGVALIAVVSAEEMCIAVGTHLEACDVLVMVAAVADWRPAKVATEKLKKATMTPRIDLVPTTDILEHVCDLKGDRCYVGFAAETENVQEEALRKLQRKHLDLIVANDVSASDAGFGVDTNRAILVSERGATPLPLMAKHDVAREIVAWIERHRRR